jgi:hypothetical protein
MEVESGLEPPTYSVKGCCSTLNYSTSKMVGWGRVELPTYGLKARYSTQLSYQPDYGDDTWIRTKDLSIIGRVLYQLSYAVKNGGADRI